MNLPLRSPFSDPDLPALTGSSHGGLMSSVGFDRFRSPSFTAVKVGVFRCHSFTFPFGVAGLMLRMSGPGRLIQGQAASVFALPEQSTPTVTQAET